MFSRAKIVFSVATLIFVATFSMGIKDCAEPSEYCQKAYSSKGDRAECTSYCAENKNINKDKELVVACQRGQWRYLNEALGTSATYAASDCDWYYAAKPTYQSACRMGVTAEELRTAKTDTNPGSAKDRETGNNK